MTSISILGSGKMARGIGTRAVAGGNKLQILDLDAQKAAALATELGGAASGTIGEPLLGDIVVLALPYKAVQPVVEQYGDRLNGKTIVDITNPIDTATFAGLVTPIDVGDLSKAHWLEGLGYLHVGLQLSRGTNFSTGLKLTGA
jgi:8-hydroxy-5-deazaflavin:NADPH oxidoreductase